MGWHAERWLRLLTPSRGVRQVDEKLLYDTFSAFGGLTDQPKVMRDPDTGLSKGFGFVSYDSFEAADLAIECMNGQFLSNRSIQVRCSHPCRRARTGRARTNGTGEGEGGGERMRCSFG